jgi:hypothetical protein
MMISITLIYVAASIAAIITAVLVFLLFRKVFKLKGITSGFWAFFIAIIPFAAIVLMNSRAVIVKNGKELTTYAVYGSPEYTFSDGQKINLNIPAQKCMLVNDTEEDLVLEVISYGYSHNAEKDALIEPKATHIFDSIHVDYAFDEIPPSSLTSDKTGAIIKYWLRTYSDYHAAYGNQIDEGGEINEEVSEEVSEETTSK